MIPYAYLTTRSLASDFWTIRGVDGTPAAAKPKAKGKKKR
jgi:hypothetical protein